MGEAVEQRRRHLRIAEDAGSFAKAEVCRDDDAGALVELAEQVEEQRSARGAERQVAKLVEDDEVGASEAASYVASLALVLLLLEGVDEFDRRKETHALAVMLDGLNANGGGEMGFPRSGAR